jgi:hypothetical protein
MKMFGFHFRRLAGWERLNRFCRMGTLDEDGTRRICGRLATIEFEGTRAARSGQQRTERIDYCDTHGNYVAKLYRARIEASDEAA